MYIFMCVRVCMCACVRVYLRVHTHLICTNSQQSDMTISTHLSKEGGGAPQCPSRQQHTATHCNTLHHTTAHCRALPHTAPAHTHTQAHTHSLSLSLSFFSLSLFFLSLSLSLPAYKHLSKEGGGTTMSCASYIVCCSVLQCVAVCCSVLQCVAVCCSVLTQNHPVRPTFGVAGQYSALRCVAVCCSVLQCPNNNVL